MRGNFAKCACGGTSQNAPVGQTVTWVVSVVNDGSSIVQTAYSTNSTASGGNYPCTYRRKYNGASWDSWQIISGKLVQSLTSSMSEIPSAKAVKDAIDAIDVNADIKAYISTVYPVGSLYFSTASTCPLQTLGIGTWNKVGTSLTLSVNTNAVVTTGDNYLGFNFTNSSGESTDALLTTARFASDNNQIGLRGANIIGSAYSIYPTPSIKVNSNSNLSATVTRTQLTVNVFQRTA